MQRPTSFSSTVAAGLALLLAACTAPWNVIDPRDLAEDPTVVVHTEQGDELGVSTEYGVVFLGRGAKGGRVEFTSWFGDGPSIEEGVVEAIGGGVFATEAEIQIPSVPIVFTEPNAGTDVVVRGRRNGQLWEIEAQVASDPAVQGLLLEPQSALTQLPPEQLGAGIFWSDPKGRPLLLGLVTGTVQISGEGGTREYVTALGPRDLWRLVVQRRNSDRPRRQVYREDIR